MAVGTEGPDHLVNDTDLNEDTIDGRGGDDTIRLFPNYNDPVWVKIDGGSGFDTLIYSGAVWGASPLFEPSWPPAVLVGGHGSGNSQNDFYYEGIERLILDLYAVSYAINGQGELAPVHIETGDTIDEITVSSEPGADVIVYAGGGDDKIFLKDVGGVSRVYGDSGDDLIDLRGTGVFFEGHGGDGNDIVIGTIGDSDNFLTGGAGDDLFYFSDSFTNSDFIFGDDGTDTLVLQGDYRSVQDFWNGVTPGLLLTDERVNDIEIIKLLSGTGTAFPGGWTSGATHYILYTADTNFAAGVQAKIDGSGLLAGESMTFNGSAETNASFLIYGGRGTDDLTGGVKNDVFLFGADGRWGSSDVLNGGAGIDQLALYGDYAVTFGANQLAGIEQIALGSASDARYGAPGGDYDYILRLLDANVASGTQMNVDASRLRLGEDFTFNGSAETDGSFYIQGGRGTDLINGGAKNDAFLFGTEGQWGSSDVVVGGAGIDQLVLRGDYSVRIGEGQLAGIEQIVLASALDNRFAAPGDRYDYSLTLTDGNVAGIQMTVNAAALRSDETLTFDGSAEYDGSFLVSGGAGDDVIRGSQNADLILGRGGADRLDGNGGNDIFRYNAVSDSSSAGRDRIEDFKAGDRIDLSLIDANTLAAGNQAFSFIGAAAFSGTAGQLRFENISAGGITWLVQGDIDGNGVSDFEIVLVINPADPITSSDFIL